MQQFRKVIGKQAFGGIFFAMDWPLGCMVDSRLKYYPASRAAERSIMDVRFCLLVIFVCKDELPV